MILVSFLTLIYLREKRVRRFVDQRNNKAELKEKRKEQNKKTVKQYKKRSKEYFKQD